MAYWGLDSGATEVLRLVNKPYTKESALEAAEKLARSGIEPSINVMPGLGGINQYSAHVEDTIDVLVAAKPRWVTMLSVDPTEEYARTIMEDAGNRHLSAEELTQQMLEITIGMQMRALGENHFKCELAAHGTDKTPIAQNPFVFKVELGDIAEMEKYAEMMGAEWQIMATPEWAEYKRELNKYGWGLIKTIAIPSFATGLGFAGLLVLIMHLLKK